MPPHGPTSPPAYAWDWFARQRLVWGEAARRLADADRRARAPHPDVPDWSSLLDATDTSDAGDAGHGASAGSIRSRGGTRDWSTLRTRADVVAALRADYPADAAVRRATDGAVADLAFLGRLDVPLEERGVRSVPRGMRWWWTHLGGSASTDPAAVGPDSSAHAPTAEPQRTLPLQLQLADVMAGYGDGAVPSDLTGRTPA